MELTWWGQACFSIKTKSNHQEVKIVIDPFSEEIGLKLPKLEADILLISHQHFDHNNKSAILGNPFVIEEPGEYEIKDVFIEGIPAFHDDKEGKERGEVIIFKIKSEGISLCHLSDLGQKKLDDEQLERIGLVDILLIPVGGYYTINGSQAREIVNQIEPKIVVPMHYSLPKLKIKELSDVKEFLKAQGQENPQVLSKLKVKSEDFKENQETEVILLKP